MKIRRIFPALILFISVPFLLSGQPVVPSVSNAVPLIATRWNQGCFYNASCPNDATATGSCLHALAGSGAVAMAQLMKFYSYPEHGTGQHAYNHPVYGNITADFSATTYTWSAMPDSITTVNDALATLLYQCGVAQEMDFGPVRSRSTFSKIDSAFKLYFNYSGAAQLKWKDNFTTAAWNAMLRAEIDAGHPVIYYGDSVGSNGQVFICDGYQGTDYFHFNWGKGGANDGYFYLSMLTPGNNNFTSNQGAIFGLVPSTPAPPAYVMDFENVPDFSLAFNPWTSVDLDGNPTYSIQLHTFPHNGSPMAFICFNPDSVAPSMSNDPELQPHSGKRFGACFSSNPPSNNDWFISPKVQLGDNPEFTFWVKSYTGEYGLEKFNVAVSTTDSLPSSFTVISGASPLEAPVLWTRKGFTLTNYKNQKVYVAIQCVSNDNFILMIDDLEIKPNSAGSLTANFTASKTIVRAGDLINFFDQSSGIPTSWSWTFDGGTPGSSIMQNPQGVRFNTVGTYDVTLTVGNGTASDTETKAGYITVTGYPSSMSLDFDSLTDFSTIFIPWITRDIGGGDTYGITGVAFPGGGSPMAWICFNPSKTVPPLANMVPHSGQKLGCSFSSMPPKNPNNKWLISPKLSLGTNASLEFWVQAYNTSYGPEKYNVGVSLTNADPASFTPLTSSPEQATDTWTKKSYDLNAYSGKDVLIGFQNVSNDAFILMIDDISINSVAGVEDAMAPEPIVVFPNPAKGELFLKFSRLSHDNIQVELMNLAGVVVRSVNLPGGQLQSSIHLTGVMAGLYTLRITKDGVTRFRKISVID